MSVGMLRIRIKNEIYRFSLFSRDLRDHFDVRPERNSVYVSIITEPGVF